MRIDHLRQMQEQNGQIAALRSDYEHRLAALGDEHEAHLAAVTRQHKTEAEGYRSALQNEMVERDAVNADLTHKIASALSASETMRAPASWRMTAAYCKVGHQFRRASHVERVLPNIARSRGFEDTPEKIERFGKEINYAYSRWGTCYHPDPAYNTTCRSSTKISPSLGRHVTMETRHWLPDTAGMLPCFRMSCEIALAPCDPDCGVAIFTRKRMMSRSSLPASCSRPTARSKITCWPWSPAVSSARSKALTTSSSAQTFFW